MNQKNTTIKHCIYKTAILSMVLVSLIGFNACKQNTGKEEDILKTCNEIDQHLADYKLKTMDGYPEPEKRKIIAYFKKDQPVLIIEEYYTDTARIFTHFYINADELIFAYRENYAYNMPVYYTEDSARKKGDTTWYDDKKTKLTTSTYLFAKNKLKKWLNNNKTEIPLADKIFADRQDELVGSCLMMLKILKTNKDD